MGSANCLVSLLFGKAPGISLHYHGELDGYISSILKMFKNILVKTKKQPIFFETCVVKNTTEKVARFWYKK